MSNYPPGVNSMHSHFNPPTCLKCGSDLDEDLKCEDEDCDFEAPDPDSRYDHDPRV